MDTIAGISYYQQTLDAIIASFITILSFSTTVHWCILHWTQSNCCSARR